MKVTFFFAIILFSSSSFSQDNMSNSPKSEKIINSFDSLFFTIGYKNGSTKINHNETSAVPGFTPLNSRSSLTNNMIELGITNEFFASSRISVSAIGNYIQEMGKDNGITKENNLTYSEKLSGNHFSAGGSLNLNLEAYNIKIQPFISSTMTKGNSRYLLSYSPISNASNPTSIQYKKNINQTDFDLGVRFIDPKVKLMSYLSLNYSDDSKNTTSASSANKNGKIDLTSISSVNSRPLTVSIGFGFFF